MSVFAEVPDTFGQLATALGLLVPGGAVNTSWFAEPTGGSVNPRGLGTVLGNDGQREALLAFVDGVLGPPDRAERAGAVWVPLFQETSPQVTIYAVVQAVADAIELGVGVEHTTTGSLPSVATRVHVPVFQLPRDGRPPPAPHGSLPGWLLLGRPGARVEVTVDATLVDGAPAPGLPSLGGVALSLGVPTAADDVVSVRVDLRDLQVPGATTPQTFTLDVGSLDALGPDVFALLTGLVRAQADALDPGVPQVRPFVALTGLLGLRTVVGLPPLPMADLPTRGIAAVVAWMGAVLSDDSARDAWLAELASLLGATVDAARDAVVFSVGAAQVSLGVRVEPGSAGHPVLTPWLAVGLDGRAGAQVRCTANLLRADSGRGSVEAFPDLRAEAVFGADAGGGALLPGDPGVGSVRLGLALGAARRPSLVFVLDDVDLAGRHHDRLDLSSPEAALDAADTLIADALNTALSSLGSAGELVLELLGLDPPVGVDALAASSLLADPVGAVARYWRDLVAAPTAMTEILGALRCLVRGGPRTTAPGLGTAADPWRIDLGGAVGVQLARDDAGGLVARLAAEVVTPVLGEFTATSTLSFTLLRAGFAPARVAFATDAEGSVTLRRTDGATARLDLGSVTLETDGLTVSTGWSPRAGLRVALAGEELHVAIDRARAPSARVALPLPSLDADGRLTLTAPRWSDVEVGLAALLESLQVPALDAMVALLGWGGSGPRLALDLLLGADPARAVEAWLADLTFDCARLQTVLGPVAGLLSGFERAQPLGAGNDRRPHRCPIAGDPRGPGLAVWLVPGCPPTLRPFARPHARIHPELALDPRTLVAALASAADALPDVADLLVGRDHLAEAIGLLTERWTGTDGLVGAPWTLPVGVTSTVIAGASYGELVALGGVGALLVDVFDAPPAAVVHVGCEAAWVTDRPAGTAFDRSVAGATGGLPPTGDGLWFVRLPTPTDAAAERPDRGAAAEQAARLAEVLAARTSPVAVVAYGACGAAAIRAANGAASVTHVVTVGTPWVSPALDALRTGLSGDALLLLEHLVRSDDAPWPDALFALEATPLQVMRALVTRSAALAADPAAIPSADAEPRRAGLDVRAVFGALESDPLAAGLGALVSDAITVRLDAARTTEPEGPHTALQVGVDLPAFDLDLGGLLVAVGATVELASLQRTPDGGMSASAARALTLDLRCGVRDGWLVGGPGASARDVEVRWMSARVRVPFDGSPGDAEITLHEARAFAARRAAWVVRSGADGLAATVALPEVRVILSAVVARLRAASTDLGALLDLGGITREGGLDPGGLDRLLHDPATTILSARDSVPAALAAALRALVPGATGASSSLAWSVGPSAVSIDLAARTLSITTAATFEGAPTLDAALHLSPTGVECEASLGTADPAGLRLVARSGAGAHDLALEWHAPGAPPRRLALLPAPDLDGLRALLTVALPATTAHGLVRFARARASGPGRAALDAALDAVGLLGPADPRGVRRLHHPVALFDHPAAWLRHGVTRWRDDPAGAAVSLLDGLKVLIAPAEPATPGWGLAEGVAVRYAAVGDGKQLRVVLDATLDAALDGRALGTRLVAGLRVGPTGPPQPVFEASLRVDGRGLGVQIAPHVRVTLEREAPASPIELYPGGPGLGSTLAAVGGMVLPPVLNALIARRTDAGPSLLKDVAAASFDLGGALDLLDAGAFTDARLRSFATDPAAQLLAHLGPLATTSAVSLARAIDPSGAIVQTTGPSAGRVTLGFGATQGVRVTLDGQSATPAVELSCAVVLPGVGPVTLEGLRLSADGVQVSAVLGPATVSAGAFALHPLLVVRAGVASVGFSPRVGVGLALDPTGSTGVQFGWALDGRGPALVVTRADGSEDASPAAVAGQLLAQAASLAAGVLTHALGPVLTQTARALLQGVVFRDEADSVALHPTLVTELVTEPPRLLHRLQRLLWNAADLTPPFALTLGEVVTVALVGDGPAEGPKRLGLSVSLVQGRRFALASGDPLVELEVDAAWVNPAVAPGLTLYLVEGSLAGGAYTFALSPAVSVAGLGLRFAKRSGPVVDLDGLSLDAIALHFYGEASPAGVGGGARITLSGLAVAPAGGGGTNAVANGIMNDAGASGAANRPSFSPSLAVQIHPGQSAPSLALRAGDPPGPWWILVQRQLGPLYLERMGFDTAEEGGRLSRISLLFDGRVSLFGLTASVDQLSLSWLGGDLFDVGQWAVDLQGLAISADLAGLSLSGGLLKSEHDGSVTYVGMLLGRFGTYGLSVFGGYTQDDGAPSFFVFGALNGPIGGPPAFFVTGIGGGLGIHRGLRVPDDLSRFNEHPFIKTLDPAAAPPADPMAELRQLAEYFPPSRGGFWFAAGVSFTCFALVDGIAVVSVAFDNGLEISLLGLARMALPRPGAALVSIELGLLARFSTREGLLSIRAQLTENSWLLYEDVRLTGGFAFVLWWKGPNKGQFVLTLGGYHPSFRREGYPEVPRLGLVWQVSPAIVVKGESYFALTSEALMAGVDVEVSADFGWAWARIAFGANGIVYFDPFWFEVEAYARISAGVKIRTLLGTIRFGISLGANVRVWGPEFSGEATLEVGPASFTVRFGSEHAIASKVLTWVQFVGKYLEEGPGGAARALSAITGRGTLPSATGGDTSAPTADGSAARPFEVFAEFELTVTTTIPTQRFDLGLAGAFDVPVTRSDGATAKLGLSPMRADLVSSTLSLVLEQRSTAHTYILIPDQFQRLTTNLGLTPPRPEGTSLGIDAFPIGAWGPAPAEDTPEPKLPRGDVLFAGSSIRIVAEATSFERGPEIDYYRVEAARRPLPLSAAGGGAREGLLTRASMVQTGLVDPLTTQQALHAAQTALHHERLVVPPVGTLPRGERSNLARAAFAGSRVAPPLFGTLADGLSLRSAHAEAVQRQDPPETRVFAGPRAPTVTGLLSAGARVSERPSRTTVADPRVPRRSAPTLAAARARLVRDLPVLLSAVEAPAAVRGSTVIAAGVVPRTRAPGAARTHLAGALGGPRGLDGLVAGLGRTEEPRETETDPPRLGRGDVMILSAPDAAVDVDARSRPSLGLDGAARVTLLASDGAVLLDAVRQGAVPMPPGVATIAIQAGTEHDGLAGWHASSRVASLGPHTALAAGCVLQIDAAGTGRGVGWSLATEVTSRATVVVTRFARPAATLVVLLRGTVPERLDGLGLELLGAKRATADDGAVRPPTVVLRGVEAALVYAITPDTSAALAVRVTVGGAWSLAGVVAGDEDVARTAAMIQDRGVEPLTARLLSCAGDGCGVAWLPPNTPPEPTKHGRHHGGR